METTIKTFIVYMAVNLINGKRYIGATSKGVLLRSQQHFKDARRRGRDCPRFYAAIRKYGPDAFEWTVLATLSTSEEMYREEERLIALLKPEYNIASGGLIFTSKEKQAKFTADNAKRCSKTVICLNDGSIYPSASAAARFYGVDNKNLQQSCSRGGIMKNGLSFMYSTTPISDSERENILDGRRLSKSASERARIEKTTNINSRPVTCLNTGVVYTSATEADRQNNFCLGTVEYLCRSKRANRSGHCFSHGKLSDPERLTLLELATNKRKEVDSGWKDKISKRRSRAVICEATGIVYDSAILAAKAHGLSFSTVSELCRNEKSRRFSYLDEWCVNPL